MSRNDIFQKVLTIVKPFVKNQEAYAKATDETRFIEDLKINSARLVDIVLAFEDEFHFPISDDEAEAIQTIGSAVDLISKKAGK
jgi:acyl carrier protein